MKSKKSCYDAAIGHITIRRYGLIGLLYTIGLVLLVVGNINATYYGNAAADLQDLCNLMPIINLAYAALLAQMLMGDLYNPRLSYALRCLPITLGGWFGTQVILGIVSVLPGILISGIILALLLTAYQTTILIFMAWALLTFLFFYGVALLSSVCAGNRIGMLLIYCIINFVGLFYGWAVMQIFSPLIYGMYLPNYSVSFVPITAIIDLTPFQPIYNLTANAARDSVYYFASTGIDSIEYNVSNSMWILLGYAAVGCVLIYLAMVLLRRRKPECAGDLLAFKQLNPVILVICALCTGILFHIIGDFFGWEMKLPMLFVGIILGYYAALMLLKRQTNVFTKRALVPLVVLLVLVFGGITATGLNLWGITYRIPDASQVEEVEIVIPGLDQSLRSSDPEAIALAIQVQQESLDDHRQIEQSRPLLTRIYGSEEGTPDELVSLRGVSTAWVTLRYTLKNGHRMNRLYVVRSTYDCIEPLNAVFSAPEYVFSSYLLDDNQKFDRDYLIEHLKYVDVDCYHDVGELYLNARTTVLSTKDVPGLLDAILQDCADGHMTQEYIFHTDDDYVGDNITFYFTVMDKKYVSSSQIRLYASCKNTMQYLIDHGYHDPIEAE